MHADAGLAPNNLLAFMALLGLLRALDSARPDWHARARWRGRPWTVELLLAQDATEAEIADAADAGIGAIAMHYRLSPIGDNQEPPRDVRFNADEFRRLVASLRDDPVGAALASVLSAESPVRRDGNVIATPLGPPRRPAAFSGRLIKCAAGTCAAGIRFVADRTPRGRWRRSSRLCLRLGRIRTRVTGSVGIRPMISATRCGSAIRATEALPQPCMARTGLAAIGMLSFLCVAGERSLGVVGSVQRDGQCAMCGRFGPSR